MSSCVTVCVLTSPQDRWFIRHPVFIYPPATPPHPSLSVPTHPVERNLPSSLPPVLSPPNSLATKTKCHFLLCVCLSVLSSLDVSNQSSRITPHPSCLYPCLSLPREPTPGIQIQRFSGSVQFLFSSSSKIPAL